MTATHTTILKNTNTYVIVRYVYWCMTLIDIIIVLLILNVQNITIVTVCDYRAPLNFKPGTKLPMKDANIVTENQSKCQSDLWNR